MTITLKVKEKKEKKEVTSKERNKKKPCKPNCESQK